jgi:hypothetical protein
MVTQTSYGITSSVATVLAVGGMDDDELASVAKRIVGHVVDEADKPFGEILRVVRERGCATIVIEESYADQDYASEYSLFWSGRFERRAPQAKRVHFFEGEFVAGDLPSLSADQGYLGYCVIRPTDLGAIGRTVIAPPPRLAKARLTRIVERPSMYGYALEVAGVPFCQQDGELLRCAHAAAWVCHYVAAHHRIVGRRLTAEIASMPSNDGSKHRPLPSAGLTGEQLQGVFSTIGIPAIYYEASDLPKLPADLRQANDVSNRDHNRLVRDQRVLSVVCKYLNSGFPVVVLTDSEHAFTLVGWNSGEDGTTRLIACDDRIGPYEEICSPESDSGERGQWRGFMIPLPTKVYLTGEAAENRARQMVSAESDHAIEDRDSVESDFSRIAPKLSFLGDGVSVRSRLIESRRYKTMLSRQGRHLEAIRVARMAHLPHWIWVVEFQNSHLRRRGEPCVLAEIVFDSTSHDERPDVSLLCTGSTMLDTKMAGRYEDDDSETLGQIWLGVLDGRKWRSLISDSKVSDREYGPDDGEPLPPGSPSAQDESSSPHVSGASEDSASAAHTAVGPIAAGCSGEPAGWRESGAES